MEQEEASMTVQSASSPTRSSRARLVMYPVTGYTKWLHDVGSPTVSERRNPFENMIAVATK
jgi:hypothetical protein